MTNSSQIQYDQNGRITSVEYTDGSVVSFAYDSAGNRLAKNNMVGGSMPKFTVSMQTTNFTANTNGTYYIISGTVTVTMASAAILGTGNMMKFKVLSGQATFAFSGTDQFGHANGISDQTLVLFPTSGVLEIVVVAGGFNET